MKRHYIIAKVLEALGIAAVMIAFVTGVYGDEWGELYLFLGGIAVFLAGRRIEKRVKVQTHLSEPIQAQNSHH